MEVRAVSLTSRSLTYFRRDRVRLSARLRLRPPNRFAFAATCLRYRWTISSPEAPAIRLAVAWKAARIFSLTINSASRRALLPPRISFIIRNAMTPFASNASNIKELTIFCPSAQPRQGGRNGSQISINCNDARDSPAIFPSKRSVKRIVNKRRFERIAAPKPEKPLQDGSEREGDEVCSSPGSRPPDIARFPKWANKRHRTGHENKSRPSGTFVG